MSQYPPYQPPNPYMNYGGLQVDPYSASLLGPCKLAATVTFIVSALLLLGGLCVGGVGLGASDQVIQPMVDQAHQPDLTPAMMRVGLVVIAALGLFLSIAMLIPGFFIWRGSSAAIIITMVMTLLACILLLINTLASLPRLPGAQGSQLVGVVCVTVVPLLIFGGLLVLLIKALKSARHYHQAKLQLQQQYWQYYQQQQMYGQAGYGYPQAPMQPPPPPPEGTGQSPTGGPYDPGTGT